jgi:VanZ family protein
MLLVALSLSPKGTIPEQSGERELPHIDKVAHFAMFAGFGFFWAASVRSKGSAAKVLAAALVLAVATELLQGLPVVDRDPNVLDALADLVGAVTGIAAGRVWRGGG